MNLQSYLSCIRNQAIPPEPPDKLANGKLIFDHKLWLEYWQARTECNILGMWPIVDQIWIGALARWIGQRKVLEIMAGAGWIAKALSQHGIDIVATDDFSWNTTQHKDMNLVFPVQKMDAVKAMRCYRKTDILLVSWPPYEDNTIVKACETWSTKRPIVYIGEGYGGCNAPEEFFEHFQAIKPQPDIPLKSWDSIHDFLAIGYWNREQQ